MFGEYAMFKLRDYQQEAVDKAVARRHPKSD
jgi:superfamily II DNA or RNA helicase